MGVANKRGRGNLICPYILISEVGNYGRGTQSTRDQAGSVGDRASKTLQCGEVRGSFRVIPMSVVSRRSLEHDAR